MKAHLFALLLAAYPSQSLQTDIYGIHLGQSRSNVIQTLVDSRISIREEAQTLVTKALPAQFLTGIEYVNFSFTDDILREVLVLLNTQGLTLAGHMIKFHGLRSRLSRLYGPAFDLKVGERGIPIMESIRAGRGRIASLWTKDGVRIELAIAGGEGRAGIILRHYLMEMPKPQEE